MQYDIQQFMTKNAGQTFVMPNVNVPPPGLMPSNVFRAAYSQKDLPPLRMLTIGYKDEKNIDIEKRQLEYLSIYYPEIFATTIEEAYPRFLHSLSPELTEKISQELESFPVENFRKKAQKLDKEIKQLYFQVAESNFRREKQEEEVAHQLKLDEYKKLRKDILRLKDLKVDTVVKNYEGTPHPKRKGISVSSNVPDIYEGLEGALDYIFELDHQTTAALNKLDLKYAPVQKEYEERIKPLKELEEEALKPLNTKIRGKIKELSLVYEQYVHETAIAKFKIMFDYLKVTEDKSIMGL